MAQRIPGFPPSFVETFGADELAANPVGMEGATFGAAIHNAAPTQVLFEREAADMTEISVNDINQGQIGDCFMLSPLGEMALFSSSTITRMIHANSNGTESVTLYQGFNGGSPGFGSSRFPLRAVTEVVTNSFSSASVNNGALQDVVSGVKEIWAQVVEKAYAQLHGGYGGIQNGGNPAIAMEELTGKAASWSSPANLTLAALVKDIAAGDLIVFDTGAGNAKYNLFGNHAYMFESLQTVGGVASVKLGNPWGYDQPTTVPVSQLGRAFVEVDIGHV